MVGLPGVTFNLGDDPFWYAHKIFRKTNISYFLIRLRVYQWIRNISYLENIVDVLNG